jgi:serine-type D-Ala-D-Ala carboxypeptidase
LSLNVRIDGDEVFHRTVGEAVVPGVLATEDQVYDLASLTKVLVTVPLCAALMEQGELSLDSRVADVLPKVDKRITVAHLLTHSSGYPAHIHLYRHVQTWGTPDARHAILEAAGVVPLEATPGSKHRYSDIGFLVLLNLLETLGGQRLDALYDDLVPHAGLTWGHELAAATEHCPVRRRIVRGEVHDLNCLALGGVSTHAGLFGSARAVGLFMDRMRVDPRIAPFVQMRGSGAHRAGFDGISVGYTSTGSRFPSDTVGHLGYTGTSTWMVPSRRAVVTLLTNRIHPVDDLAAIREARPQVHDAVAAFLGWNG